MVKPVKPKRKAKPGLGPRKGSAFEREVCKGLSLWVSSGRLPDLFWRTASSGGRATQMKKKGVDLGHVAGDICSTHPAGESFIRKYFIECKAYRDLNIPQLVMKETGLLAEFWSRARVEAESYGKIPILIFKQNQYPVCVCSPLFNAFAEEFWGKKTLFTVPRLNLHVADFNALILEYPRTRRSLTI